MAWMSVSIHAPARGATFYQDFHLLKCQFQFTRPQGARRQLRRRRDARQAVSIHAPARGATPGTLEIKPGIQFQFTRPQGARPLARPMIRVCSVFQFTRPQGARLAGAAATDPFGDVSIHAPARGATWEADDVRRRIASFNSRARKGRDSSSVFFGMNFSTFQFTRPQGARRLRPSPRILSRSFNSRARKGRDAKAARLPCGVVGFNSRARKGRDTQSKPMTMQCSVFQFTRPQGARRQAYAIYT